MIYKDANAAVKGAKKRDEKAVTFKLAKPMPKRGERTAKNKAGKK